MSNTSERKCDVCSKSAKQFCASCKSVFYCSRECQKKAWKVHKHQCHPFTIQTHDVYGRYAVASRDIKAGEIILKEAPLILGPKQITTPVCLGCYATLQQSKYFCKQCHYPMCSAVCQNSIHHKHECSVLTKAKQDIDFTKYSVPHPAYECITPLRCALLKNHDPDKWNAMMDMQSHEEEFEKTNMHNVNKRNVVLFIRDFFGYQTVDEEIIHRICGILLTNSFELMCNGQRIRGLYASASKFAHNCTPNTKHVFDDDQNIIIRTTRNLTKGQTIFVTYSQTLWDTMSRRHHLSVSKLFMCECERCSDPTELGTNMSSLLCTKCGGEVLSDDPCNSESNWTCSRCSNSILARQIRFGNEMLNKELRGLSDGVPMSLENFIDRYKGAIHSNHRFMVEAKYALIKFYGNSSTHPYKSLSQEQLENKVKWCKELLDISNVLDPDKSLLRGTVLFELQAGLVAVAKSLHSNDLITQEQTEKYMTEAVGHLSEASEILKHEPQYENGGLEKKLKWLSDELEI